MLFFWSLKAWSADVVVGDRLLQEVIREAQSGDRLLLEDRVYLECLSIASKKITLVGGRIEGEGRCDALIQIVNAEVSFDEIALSNGQKSGIRAVNSKINLLDISLDSMGSSRGVGSIYAEDSHIEIKGGRINASTGEKGGGIHVKRSTVFVDDLTCSQNRAAIGGAFYLDDQSTAKISNSRFIGNQTSSGGMGGAFAVRKGSTLELSGVQVHNNHAQSKGGAIYMEQSVSGQTNTLLVYETSFLGNTASFGSGSGGAIYIRNAADVLIEKSQFRENAASTHGGAIFLYDLGTEIKLVQTQLVNNKARSGAGGAIAGAARQEDRKVGLSIVDCYFERNASNIYGGAIALGDTINAVGELKIEGTNFVQNKTTSSRTGAGGAIYFNSGEGSTVELDGSRFENNRSELSGGAIYLNGMERAFLSDLEIFENSAQGSSNALMRYGGGIMVARSKEVVLKRIKMCGNHVGRKKGPENGAMGGAIHLQELETVQLHGSSLWQNSSAVKGGTVSVLDVQSLELLGNTILASYASQGAIWSERSQTIFENNIVSFTQSGGALALSEPPKLFENNNLYSNTGGDMTVSDFLLAYNVLENPKLSGLKLNNVCTDDDLSLLPESPLLNAGAHGLSIGAAWP